jgi:ectoine hydroxylase-related dioxygenase (phytanoyl-CoA dioxygenase family)
VSGQKVDDWAGSLGDAGYCIIPQLVPPAKIAALEADLDPVFAATPFGQGDFYGYKTKRAGGLPRRPTHVHDLILEPTILALARKVLGEACDCVQLNVAQAIEIHPGEVVQFPHADQDMWAGIKGQHEYLLNVIWPISPFTAENGATRIYPGTHREPPGDIADLPAPVVAACPPGSAICFLGSTVHAAGANLTGKVRRALVIGYSLGWLKPYENLWLAYPPQVARSFPPALRALAGYVQHRPNLGNYEGQWPSVLLDGNAGDHLGAIDARRTDQAEALARFAADRRRPG